MEDGLGEGNVRGPYGRGCIFVLILVLVEDGLGGRSRRPSAPLPKRLNPCFSGGWSRSAPYGQHSVQGILVLILVLVEDGLGA